MPLGGIVGRVPLQTPGGFLPYPPAKDTGMNRAVVPKNPAVLVGPGHSHIAEVPRVPGPLVLNGQVPLAKAVNTLPVHGMLPGQFAVYRICYNFNVF